MRTTAIGVGTVALGVACGGGFAPEEGAWDAATPSAFVASPPTERVRDVAWLPDGTLAALTEIEADHHLEVRFFGADGAAARPPLVWGADVGGAYAIVPSPDGTAVIVPDGDELVVAPLDGGEPTRMPFADPADSLADCRSPWQLVRAGTLVAGRCSVGYAVGLVDLETGTWLGGIPIRDPDGRNVTVQGLAVSPDGRWLAASGQSEELLGVRRKDAWVEIREVAAPESGRRIPVSAGGEPLSGGVAFSPDGSKLAVTHPYWGFVVVDVASGAVLVEQPGARDRDDRCPEGVIWHERALLRVGRRCAISAHDPATGAALGWFPAHPEEPVRPHHETPAGWPEELSHRNEILAVSPDGRTLASYERQDWLPSYPIRLWTID